MLKKSHWRNENVRFGFANLGMLNASATSCSHHVWIKLGGSVMKAVFEQVSDLCDWMGFSIPSTNDQCPSLTWGILGHGDKDKAADSSFMQLENLFLRVLQVFDLVFNEAADVFFGAAFSLSFRQELLIVLQRAKSNYTICLKVDKAQVQGLQKQDAHVCAFLPAAKPEWLPAQRAWICSGGTI